MHVSTAVYAMADEAWRAEARPWYARILDLLEAGQMECTGIIQNQPFAHLFDAQYRCRQSIEAAVIENALAGVRETVLLGLDEGRTQQLDAVLTDTLYAMVSPPVWNPSYPGPEALMATAPITFIMKSLIFRVTFSDWSETTPIPRSGGKILRLFCSRSRSALASSQIVTRFAPAFIVKATITQGLVPSASVKRVIASGGSW